MALSSPCLIALVAFLIKVANSFFESLVSSLALFFQDLLLPLPFLLVPLLPFRQLLSLRHECLALRSVVGVVVAMQHAMFGAIGT